MAPLISPLGIEDIGQSWKDSSTLRKWPIWCLWTHAVVLPDIITLICCAHPSRSGGQPRGLPLSEGPDV